MSAGVRSRVRSALAFLATVIIGGGVRANAPPGQYEAFERGDHCISDRWTKLTWIRQPILSTASFGDAVSQCAKLTDAGPALWRVPTVNELETLVDEAPHLEGTPLRPHAIDVNAFPETRVDNTYWTSSVAPGGMWVVFFEDGSTTIAPTSASNQYLRCVIEWPSLTTPATCPL